ncbi:MAG: DNA translocase FtsK [Candidatus Nealsonbacteria bacterium]
MKKKNSKKRALNNYKPKRKLRLFSFFTLPEEIKKWILGVVVLVIAIIVALSFFDLAGVAGKVIMRGLTFLVGNGVFVLPLILALGGLAFLNTKYDKFMGPSILAMFLLILGISGALESFDVGVKSGGWLGYIITWPILKFFGQLVSEIIFFGIILIGALIFWYLMKPNPKFQEKIDRIELEQKPSLIKQIFFPKLKIKELEPRFKEESSDQKIALDLKSKEVPASKVSVGEYKIPPLELLEEDKGKPLAGDTIVNSAIIKKTLENFGLKVEMSEVIIGPTVTRYSLKPAEGVKLSKITGLSNNLSLALAAHPIRIEAPIPGKSLVGIEIPNKERARVGLRELVAHPEFQKSNSNLIVALGKDVSGATCYADLTKMPHMLVAGATGTGKTVFLNSLILGLLYQNSPEIMRLILIDPKRVEFSAFKELPHLLCPVIFDAQKAINALKWLASEMERRFDVLASNGSRNLSSYNQKVVKDGEDPLPYIVLIVDELADLMVVRGKDMEAGIVRLAQMARAVGIHLVLATQRPSVEVITGLIKANVTARVTFQVASQIDSRTVLDMGGAEKLLGAGDLLFISADQSKPKRIQGAYASEKEVRRVVDFVESNNGHLDLENAEVGVEGFVGQGLQRILENNNGGDTDFNREGGGDDPLYEDAKRTVIESKKASASLLQRRLRVGYARAARLLDILEDKGIVGPGDGAKPREVYLRPTNPVDSIPVDTIPTETKNDNDDEDEDNEWSKV